MQQIFLFCSMLIIASEVFSEELRGSQIPKSTKRRTSRFAHRINYQNPDRYMLRSFNFPMFLVPPAYQSPLSPYEAPFLVPLPRCGCESMCRKRNFSRGKKKRFRNRKRFRRKHLRKMKRRPKHPVDVPNSFIFNSPESFENFWYSGVQPRRNSTHFFGNVFDSRDSVIRNPNQYIVCLYPVFIRPEKKGTIDFYKNRRFSNLRRQYLINLRNKNKRSARNLNPVGDIPTDKLPENEDMDEGHKSQDQNLGTRSELPRVGVTSSTAKKDASTEKQEISNDNSPYSPQEFNTSPGPPQNFRYDLYSNLERYPEGIFSSHLNMATDLDDGYLDMTPPSVTLPKITFKYPYDPRLYESPYNQARFTEPPIVQEVSTEENVKRNVESPTKSDMGKLKQMLEEVESLLSFGEDDKSKKKNKLEDTHHAKGTESCNKSISLKEKIDTVVIPILTQISMDLGKMSSNKSHAGGENKKGKALIRCSPDGTWKSSVFGVEMTFTTMPNMMLKVKITSTHGSVINQKWSIQGLTLSKRGPLMLAAVYPQKKQIASFIGQCKMCRDQDLIFGSWTIYTCMRRFTDLWRAVETKLDILRNLT